MSDEVKLPSDLDSIQMARANVKAIKQAARTAKNIHSMEDFFCECDRLSKKFTGDQFGAQVGMLANLWYQIQHQGYDADAYEEIDELLS